MSCITRCPCAEISFGISNKRELRYRDVATCAASGCTLCCIVRDAPGPFYPRGYTFESNVTAYISKSGLILEGFSEKLRVFSLKAIALPQSVTAYLDCGIPSIPCSTAFQEDRGSPDSPHFLKAVKWFTTCMQQHHILCSNPLPPVSGFLPDRILDLKAWPNNDDVVLRETKSIPGKYACLSHCWGGFQPLRTTTTTTLPHRLKRIPFQDLPKTFQDAVTFARSLDFQFLWIDSLCIIQDSLQDWTTQSSQMATIYRDALLTISASGSPGPGTGFLSTSSFNQNLSSFNNRPDCTDIFVHRARDSHQRLHHPLLSRAWAFQERLLCPRVLHFGQDELIWECMEKTTCECGGIVCKASTMGGDHAWYEPKATFHPGAMAYLPSRRLSNIWYNAVNDFTYMKLSFPSDMLVAVAGAAAEMKKGIQGWYLRNQPELVGTVKYFAGLWSFMFIEDCLWMAQGGSSASRPPAWRAPTFSWASVHNARCIQFPWTHFLLREVGSGQPFVRGISERDKIQGPEPIKLYAELIEGNCTPLPGNTEFGQLSAGYVILSGPLLEAKIVYWGKDSRCDLEIANRKENRRSGQPDFRQDYDLRSPEDSRYSVPPGSEVWCLVMMKTVYEARSQQIIHALVLRRVKEGKSLKKEDVDAGSEGWAEVHENMETFERIGLVKYVDPCLHKDVEECFDTFDESFVVKIV